MNQKDLREVNWCRIFLFAAKEFICGLKSEGGVIKRAEKLYILDDIGTLFYEQGRYAEALEYYYKSLKVSDELKSTYSRALTQYHLALTYKMQKNYKAAKENNDLALDFLKTQFQVKDYSRAELLASQIDSANGNGNGAFEHYKQFIILNNKL